MRNPTVIVKVLMFDNDLLFYKSEQFKVIPRTMSFSLLCFTEWEERGGVSQCAGTTPMGGSVNVKHVTVVGFLVGTWRTDIQQGHAKPKPQTNQQARQASVSSSAQWAQ